MSTGAQAKPPALLQGRNMDLRLFYQKLRKIEQEITDPHVLVVSHETSDGGRAGQKSEVSRAGAAEVAEHRAAAEQARQEFDQRAMAQKIQVNVVSEADFRAIKSASRPE